jgi:predicted MPP superfamily phosphohydrolase
MRRIYIFLAIGGFLIYSGLIEPYWLVEKTHDLAIEGFRSREVTIVHIADIHTTKFGSREADAVRRIEAIDPDYILLTGDLLKSESRLSSGLEFISKLKARYGVYIVPGNADGVLDAAIARGRLPKDSLNYKVLMNESVDCGPFVLVGLDDPVTGRHDVGRAFEGVSDLKPVFVLCHFHPDSMLEELKRRGVDVVFSGHTHGGQVGLAALVGLVPYAYRSRYIGGLYTLDRLTLSVTRGVGTNIFPLRFLCRPEIVIFRIRGL